MFLSSLRTTQCLLVSSIILVLASASVQASGQGGCVDECNSYAADPSSVSRCIKYECRKRVFSYYIRFGKRSGTNAMAQNVESSNRLHSLLRIFLSRQPVRTLSQSDQHKATLHTDVVLQQSPLKLRQQPQPQLLQQQQPQRQFSKRDDSDSVSRELRIRQLLMQRRRQYRLLESLLRFG